MRSSVWHHYNAASPARQIRLALVVAAALSLGACSALDLTIAGPDRGPVSTGSLSAPLEVARPLPRTLDVSDAAIIGRTALAAAGEPDQGEREWINGRTGSSGTLALLPTAESAVEPGCKAFGATVTSLVGVHRYSGRICRKEGGSAMAAIAMMVEEGG
ncbi:RT0821/Lpp0805 family surface protein [Faunimonas sp. B44]|uniref:RT0821/Lpp0805 family surface protein n=1 Tax=Faunimonas sp. B44 TaxID=3461493 RepID=UPI00404463BC